mgnify:FL=1
MWALFEQGRLRPDTPLTGHFEFDEHEADVDAVRDAIDEARREQDIREQGRQDAERGED